jgi:hypothetical protein
MRGAKNAGVRPNPYAGSSGPVPLTGKRGEIIEEYFGYVSQLKPGKAGKLSLVEGDTSAAV